MNQAESVVKHHAESHRKRINPQVTEVRGALHLGDYGAAVQTICPGTRDACRLLIQHDSDRLASMSEELDWERLGALLRRRRIELSAGVNNRSQFFRDRGLALTGGPARVLSGLETGERENFEQGSLDLAEYHYRWKPGSAARVLRGGEPMPEDENVSVSDERPPVPAWRQELRDLIDRVPEVEFPRVRDYLRGVVEHV